MTSVMKKDYRMNGASQLNASLKGNTWRLVLANLMIQRLRDAPVENEDAFQHIDDDMLAQGLAHVKEASLKAGSSHSQQVSRFHKNLKGAQGEVVERLSTLSLSPSPSSSSSPS